MSERLTTDYEQLVQRYQKNAPEMVKGMSDTGRTILPVIESHHLQGYPILVEDHPEDQYQLPDEVKEHYDELMSDYSDSTIYDNTNIRVTDWKMEGDKFVLQTGRTTYFSSLVTNRSMDKALSDGSSVREKVEGGPELSPLVTSKLSNHLGFNGFLESADGKICLIDRNQNVSIGKNTYGTSVGASLKSKYALQNGKMTTETLQEAIRAEYNDELKVMQSAAIFDKQGLTHMEIVSAYRDLLEGGKPQLLVYARSDLTAAELSEGFQAALIAKQMESMPKEERALKEFHMREDGNRLVWVDARDFQNAKVEAGKVTIGKKEYVMLPSASASVQMTADLLKEKRRETVKPHEDMPSSHAEADMNTRIEHFAEDPENAAMMEWIPQNTERCGDSVVCDAHSYGVDAKDAVYTHTVDLPQVSRESAQATKDAINCNANKENR